MTEFKTIIAFDYWHYGKDTNLGSGRSSIIVPVLRVVTHVLTLRMFETSKDDAYRQVYATQLNEAFIAELFARQVFTPERPRVSTPPRFREKVTYNGSSPRHRI